MSSLVYRRDIDGLRAVAVIAVVLFHFGVPGLTGGFVGVDVFFVISGYLITSIIWHQREAGRFSFVEFWARPALHYAHSTLCGSGTVGAHAGDISFH